AAFLSDTTGTLDGRPIFRFNGFGPRLPVSSVDTGQIIDADSARLQLYIVRRDTATHNLRLQFYRLPTTIDTTTTFDSLAGQFTRDSSQIIRGTLFLVPAVAARGAPADSFVMEARTVLADFGRKSPIDARLDDPIVIHPGATDTIKIEVTSMLQLWAADTTHPTVFLLR